MNLLSRQIFRLGSEVSARLDHRLGNQHAATGAAFNVRGSNGAAQQTHEPQIERCDGQRGYILKSCHAMPKAKPAQGFALFAGSIECA